MEATILDLRKNMKAILAALDRNERVTLTYRGKKKAVIVPCTDTVDAMSASDHPAVGMWSEHAEVEDVEHFVRQVRKGRLA